MAKSIPPSPDDDRKIADVGDLFRDESERPEQTKPQPVSPGGKSDLGSYELGGDDLPEGEAPVPPIPVDPPPATRRPKGEGRAERPATSSTARVDEVWSRGAEWGATLVLLGVVALAVGALVYLTFGVVGMTLSFLILLAGLAMLVVLSYPIVITLERPVRITPEQAVKDFYGALSHHMPHYRRMWLLLSSDGRVSPSHGSFEGFKAYWKGRLKALRDGHASGFTPLNFRVDDFKSEKSVGKTAIDAKFTVNVFVRGKQDAGPIETVRVETGLVKGPDQMWYLNKGILPGARA